MRRTIASGISTILLTVAALLASNAGVLVPSAGATPALGAVECAHERSADVDGGARTALLRAQAPTIGRTQPSSSADAQRSAVVLGARTVAVPRVVRSPGAAVDARRVGVGSPGQPAPTSRAPPVA